MAETKILYASICLFFGFLMCTVQSAKFEFRDGQQACILLDIDASFDLSQGTEKADPFSIDGANVTAGQSLCGTEMTTAVLSLKLFPSGESFKINFRKDLNSRTVSMSTVLNIEPKKHFENASEILPFELENSIDLPIGMTNMSYICNSEQKMFFNQDPGYSMTMSITNLHVQAYDIENGEFSTALECSQDDFTSPPTTAPPDEPTTTSITPETTTPETPITIVPETTTPEAPVTLIPETTTQETPASLEPETTTVNPIDNSTSPEPETMSPSNEPETTTAEVIETTTPIKIPKYEVKDGDVVCIVVQGKIRFEIQYERNDNQMGTSSIDLPKEAKVSGACTYNETNTTQELIITFFNDTWSFTVLIAEDAANMLKRTGPYLQDLQAETSYSWQNIELKYVIDEQFDDPKTPGQKKNVTKDVAGNFKASPEGSYRCNTGETIQLGEDLYVDLTEFQYKAFNTDDSGDFSNNGTTACPADNPDNDGDDDDDTVAIVLGSVFGGLAFIILVVAIGVCVRRNRYKNYEVM
ncbi:uncharacterized protein LOC132748279 [Ruditapes philippinarum]|uniref:uncharacterized protein LOC132748279 n=1 Tax=Ruditapes philippinarum TaxID=129788 RepID=UPI00295B44CA|nr:uncharacterized protein LOC132748279 [Ruditapes philippinarum]